MDRLTRRTVLATLIVLLVGMVPLSAAPTQSAAAVTTFMYNGRLIDKIVISSPPPSRFTFRTMAVPLPTTPQAGGMNVISNVPALTWCFGCSATSAAMMCGYYDNVGYPNMYSGPTNGGNFPMTNASWGSMTDGTGTQVDLCPLSATRDGLDGRVGRGHVDDYWVSYLSGLLDPFITNGWTQHVHGDCTGDYMGTNQYNLGNDDGSTSFYFYTDGSPLEDFTGAEPTSRDGCHGMRLFGESRGYTVVRNYSQYIAGYNGNSQGFSFADFEAEIDAGRPVLIQVEGHTMLGFGYDDSSQTVYIHDTWDHLDHTMPWGGDYRDMTHYGVTVLQLAPTAPRPARSVSAFDTPNDTGGSITVTWSKSLDDGRGFDNVLNYEVWRSTEADGTFTHLGDVPKGSKGYVDMVPANYVDYYYIVYACNGAYRTASRVTQPAAARDDIAPDPVTVTAADTVADSGGSISLNWSSYAPPQDYLEYRVYRAEKSFDNVTADGVTLLGTITSSTTKSYQDRTTQDNKDYYYAVTCLDTSLPANENKTVTAAGPARSNPNYAFAYPPGLALISVGLTLQNNQLSDIFDLSSGLQFARWNPALSPSGAYVVYDAATSDTLLRVTPGRGFWMRGTRPIALSLSGASAENDVRVDFSIGWNQLGNPYTGDVDVTADGTGVRVGGTFYTLTRSNELRYTRDFFWTYDSFTNSYKLISPNMALADTVIHKGEGFFFLADRAGQLVLKNPNGPAPAAVAAAPEKAPADEWSLRLVAAIDGASDTDNFLGVSSRAAAISRIISPPPAGDGPDLYFAENGGRTATDFVESLGQGHAWTAEVACARPGAPINLTWPDLSALPNDVRPVLTDTMTGRSVYMRTVNGYGFTLGPNEASRRFTIEISTKAGDTLVIQSLQTHGAGGNVCISYSLSAAAAVEVEIRNVAGRLVRRLGTGSLSPAGAHDLLWNCAGDSGLRVPAGNYLVCVTGRTESGQVVKAVQPVSVRR